VYGLLGLVLAAVCVSVLRSIGTFMALVRASHRLHNKMLGKQLSDCIVLLLSLAFKKSCTV
jgi:hypothetical protein